MKWTKERLEQLETLRSVLYIATGLNHGSGVAENIIKLECEAKKLLPAYLDFPTPSFFNFLQNLAIEERQKGQP